MKIIRLADTKFDNLPEGTVVRSDLYRREKDIKLGERTEKKDPFGGTIVTYRALFTGTGRMGDLDARDITSVVSLH